MISTSKLNKLRQFGKLLLALILLSFIISRVSLPDLIRILRTLEIRYLFGAYILYLLIVVLSTYRWYILYSINKQQGRPSFGKLLSVNFMGIFFNNVMPSSVGGDVFRVLHMSKEVSGFSNSFSTIFVDRFIGLFSLVLVGLLAIVFGGMYIDLPTGLTLWGTSVFVLFCAVLVLISSTHFQALLFSITTFLLSQPRHEWVQKKLARFSTHVTVYSEDRKLLITPFIASITSQIVWIVGCYVASLALHLSLPIYVFFVTMPLIELVRAIPLTIQGIGIREGAFVIFFAQFGVSVTEATILAFLIYFLLTLNGVLGGIIYFLDPLMALARRWRLSRQ